MKSCEWFLINISAPTIEMQEAKVENLWKLWKLILSVEREEEVLLTNIFKDFFENNSQIFFRQKKKERFFSLHRVWHNL